MRGSWTKSFASAAVLAFYLHICVLILCGRVLAHHGTFASYDRDKTIGMKGTVTQFQFAYPHPLIFFDVKDESGNAVHWAAEINPHKVPTAKVCRAQELTVNDKKIY